MVAAGSHDGDASELRVHDPVFGHTSFAIERFLLLLIPAPRAGRDDLHNEDWDGPRLPAAVRVRVRLPHHEVGLDLRAPETNHGAWVVHVAESVRRNEWSEEAGEPRQDFFVLHGRRWRHEELSVHQLVLVAVVR